LFERIKQIQLFISAFFKARFMTELHLGHRQRLLERYAKSGITGMHDYEIVELVLSFIIPRKDIKPMAKELIGHFKTIGALVHADPAHLEKFKGMGPRSARFFSLFKDVMAYCLNEQYEKQSIITKRRDVENYLRFHFGMRKDEFVAALFLDNSSRVIATEEITEGTVNQCVVYPRVIIEKALKHGATSLILAHNHPGGCANASEPDWLITEKLYAACKVLDMTMLDHIIIMRDQVISLKDHPRWPDKPSPKTVKPAQEHS